MADGRGGWMGASMAELARPSSTKTEQKQNKQTLWGVRANETHKPNWEVMNEQIRVSFRVAARVGQTALGRTIH